MKKVCHDEVEKPPIVWEAGHIYVCERGSV